GGAKASVRVALTDGTLVIDWPEGVEPKGKAISSFDLPLVRKPLEKVGFKSAAFYGDAAAGGFEWAIPGDPSAALAFETKDGASFVASARGGRAKPSTGEARTMIGQSAERWREWWRTAAKVSVPEPEIQEIYDYGMYRFGAMTDPDGVPAPLQGPWYEEYKLPPWNGDYHFNINVEMCYWPAFHGNKLGHLKPLFRMVKGWWPILRENARKFCGVEDGFMLPHSVDDRGTLIGGFWSGTIDHGCTAWMAQLMFRYVRYSGDLDFLRSDAYPFMKGAMKVYRAMMEERDGRLSIAATTSPEWWATDFPMTAGGGTRAFSLPRATVFAATSFARRRCWARSRTRCGRTSRAVCHNMRLRSRRVVCGGRIARSGFLTANGCRSRIGIIRTWRDSCRSIRLTLRGARRRTSLSRKPIPLGFSTARGCGQDGRCPGRRCFTRISARRMRRR
ncbi:MAG: hypothetical protein IKL85_07180, partial [Lentisphaeria bacterium]|nr:hypothetical protein [Lentisphaeria bacterium]